MSGHPYTSEELARAWKLKDTMTWRQVGARLGRPWRSLQITAKQYRRGVWAPHRIVEKQAAERARIEALASFGVMRLKDYGAVFNISESAACKRLMRMGLDAEMRREAAKYLGV